MSQIFLTSDSHFGHEKCWSTFKRDDGSPLRDFKSTEDMDNTMVENWNKVVGPKDVVYHLGDVVINRRYMSTLFRLNGRKKLVRGNHDIFATKEYMEHFEEIYGTIKVQDYILTHVPIHPDSIPKWCAANLHGHLHSQRVKDKWGKNDLRYVCLSVERTNYTPVPIDEVMNVE